MSEIKSVSNRQEQIQQEFEAFHKANPHVYANLEMLVNRAVRNGRKNWSINGAFEVMRWEMAMPTKSPDNLKLGNNLRPYYARLFEERNPHLQGFFRTRRLVSEKSPPHFGPQQSGFEKPGDETRIRAQLNSI